MFNIAISNNDQDPAFVIKQMLQKKMQEAYQKAGELAITDAQHLLFYIPDYYISILTGSSFLEKPSLDLKFYGISVVAGYENAVVLAHKDASQRTGEHKKDSVIIIDLS